MKILVTGVAGFIGFHTAKHLMNQGHNIIGIDNINDYYDVSLKYNRLKELGVDNISESKLTKSRLDPNFFFQKMDISARSAIETLFSNHKFDVVIHLAAQAGVRYSIENPHAYIDSNIVGFMNILEGCRHNAIKHLIYASSSSVYGMNAKVPFSEDDQVDHPVSLYAATKKSNELMAHTYSHLYKLPTTGLRFFTVYGPWGRPDMAPMLFAKAITEGKPIKVFNNGDMKRDFTYIEDIVNGVISLINKGSINTDSPPYQILNIGHSSPVDLMEFIQVLESKIGKKAQLEMYPMQAGDVKITYADTSKLTLKTGYKPNVGLTKGIVEFIDWYKRYYRREIY